MKKLFFLIIPALLALASCQKTSVTPADTTTTATATATTVDSSSATRGYIIVTCDNCKIDYGMPDQYKTFNVSGTSIKAYFTYIAGYSLQTYIYALDHEQKITYTVYNANDKIVYTGSLTQATIGFWDLNTPLVD